MTWIKMMVRIRVARTLKTNLINRERFCFAGNLFSLPDKFIAHSPNRADQKRLAGIVLDLFPQTPDMDRYCGGICIEFITPHIGQELGSCEDLLGILGKIQ